MVHVFTVKQFHSMTAPKVQSHPQLLSQGTDNLIEHYKHLIMAICSISGIYGYLKGLYYLWLSPFKAGYLIRPKQNFQQWSLIYSA
jgi:hypothetical protein